MIPFRHQPKDAPGVLGVILTGLDPLSKQDRLDAHQEKLDSFRRARVEPRAPDLFPDRQMLERYIAHRRATSHVA